MKKVLNKFLNLFKDNKIKTTGYVYNMDKHNSWGNSINWLNWDERKITGHFSNPRLEIGDTLLFTTRSGKIGKVIISSIEYCNDPIDMFFGKVIDDGYTESDIENKKQHKGFFI